MTSTQHREPSRLESLVPIVALVALLGISVFLYGGDSSYGPNQIALMVAAMVAAALGIRNGYKWKELEAGIVHGISLSTSAVLILLMVGALIGTWILSGTVPTMIYYGLGILSPDWFYPAAVIICAVVALATGSSWTTAGTIGVALVGVAAVQGLDLGIAAGAIISGAYFGDKMSPLSDTTNLAPAMAGTDLFTHIRHMLWTTIPSVLIALVIFSFLGLSGSSAADATEIATMQQQIAEQFVVNPLVLLPVVLVIALVLFKMPAFPALFIGSLAGAVFAVLFQQEAVIGFVGEPELGRGVALLKGAWTALHAGFVLESGNAGLDDLLSRGGMVSMLNTVWLILSAMTFGAVMETTGMLQCIANWILGAVRGTGSLIAATLGTAIGMNVIASDQYMAIVLPGRMFRAEFERRNLAPENLSRTLEDSGTLTSVLVPWNTCGAFMAGTLGVATLTYAPFAFFNMLSPLVAVVYGITGISIKRIQPSEATGAGAGD
ncbi:MAG: Na+/H+ antiporter NhaC [Gemmatimonadetes bacterium]|nr:Na+/H+ antiporter NhaC [Gemmatimonadota bacterium]MBT8404002.1 Na+/H+ antiporter NhaC [Gemmatimonadota bacterium]NNF38014.1 Na+/H+ antiporter NhaC [Gemmatimonadota bacterium]NNK64662.1 Na+/H+ antiporter NhaC [Gemmatimonadota bacterium]